jgi:hypothetical protein
MMMIQLQLDTSQKAHNLTKKNRFIHSGQKLYAEDEESNLKIIFLKYFDTRTLLTRILAVLVYCDILYA